MAPAAARAAGRPGPCRGHAAAVRQPAAGRCPGCGAWARIVPCRRRAKNWLTLPASIRLSLCAVVPTSLEPQCRISKPCRAPVRPNSHHGLPPHCMCLEAAPGGFAQHEQLPTPIGTTVGAVGARCCLSRVAPSPRWTRTACEPSPAPVWMTCLTCRSLLPKCMAIGGCPIGPRFCSRRLSPLPLLEKTLSSKLMKTRK